MRGETISEALGLVKDQYIREALEHQQKKHRRWPVLAACLVLVCLGGYLVGHGTGEDLPGEETLPLLEAQLVWEGMGFEAVMVYDIQELSQTNPWTPETQLETLPVYQNLAFTDGAGAPAWLSDRELLDLAQETAERMGTSVTSKSYESALEGDLSYRLTAETDRGTIRVFGDGGITVEFSQPWTMEAAQRLVGYTVESSWTDYTFAGEANRHIGAWQEGENLTEAILHYNFAQADFAQNEEGKVWLVRWGDHLQAAEKLGDYGIISLEEARDLLLAGDYLTSVPPEYGMLDQAVIAKEELIYVTGNICPTFQPYYRFWVELTGDPSEKAEGLKTYGAYYVPAVNGIFLKDFPIYQ